MNYSGCRVEAKLGPWDAHLGLLVRDWQSYVKHLYFFKPWGQTFKTSSLSPLGWFGLIPEIRSWPTHPFALCSPDFISPFVPPLDLPTCGVCVIAHPHLLVWITSEWRVLTNGSLAKIALKVPPLLVGIVHWWPTPAGVGRVLFIRSVIGKATTMTWNTKWH